MVYARRAALAAMLWAAGCSSGGAGDGNTPDGGTASSSGSGSGSSSGSGSGEAGLCSYPAGPYGLQVGAVLDPTLQWQGYAPGTSDPASIHVADFFDCDGKKGINAFLVDTSAQWCQPCQMEAAMIPQWLLATGMYGADWKALGVQVLTLVIQDSAYAPATIATARQWRTMFGLTSIYVAADPVVTFPAEGVPLNVLVDPRTMKIVWTDAIDTDGGSAGDDAGDDGGGALYPAPPQVAQLAAHNKK